MSFVTMTFNAFSVNIVWYEKDNKGIRTELNKLVQAWVKVFYQKI